MASDEYLRVPFDPNYVALVGKAVYVFAYYEWAVIYLMEQFERGFVARYCRKEIMTSGKVKKKLQSILDDPATVYTEVSSTELRNCCDRFGKLIDKQNALIHAHLITDADGSQISTTKASPIGTPGYEVAYGYSALTHPRVRCGRVRC